MADVATQRRRVFLDLVRRRVQPGSGSSLEFLRSRTWSDPTMAVDLSILRTPFVIVGGVATALYMPQRLTLDLDVLVRIGDTDAFAGELRQAGCSFVGPLAVGGQTWQTPDGSTLDVLESDAPWVGDAVRSPNWSPSGLPVIGLPYLVLMKLAASRAQDLADISRMLGDADEATLSAVRATVLQYRPAERDDLESLIALGKLEFIDPS